MKGKHDRDVPLRIGRGYVQLGLVGQLMGALLVPATMGASPWAVLWANLLLVLGTSVLVVGCGMLAAHRGRSAAWGLLGLLNIVGVIILLMLERPRRKDTRGFEVHYLAPYRRDVWRMDVRVKLDASLGAGDFEPILLQMPRGGSVASAVKMLAGVVPALRLQNSTLRYQINGRPSKPLDELSEDDELIIGR